MAKGIPNGAITLRITFDRPMSAASVGLAREVFAEQIGELLIYGASGAEGGAWGMGMARVEKVEPVAAE